MNYKTHLQRNKDLIGMVHVKAMPGTPANVLLVGEIIDQAVKEARVYKEHGFRTVIIENMHDTPYIRGVGPEVTSIMAVIGVEVKKLGLYCGIQILSHSNKQALAVANACGLDFIRAEGFVFAHIGDEGYNESSAGELLRYRRQIGAEHILVLTDIKKKHSSHAITNDVSLKDTAEAAKFFCSDGIIITGSSTGKAAELADLEEVRDMQMVKMIGSGLTEGNLKSYINLAEGFIVGSSLKKEGHWANELDTIRLRGLIKEFRRLK